MYPAIQRTSFSIAAEKKGAAGSFYSDSGELYLNLTDGALRLVTVQADGKKQMSGREYLIGHRSILEKTVE